MTHKTLILIGLLMVVPACGHEPIRSTAELREVSAEPVINAHMHAAYLEMNDAEYLAQVIGEMDENNIELAVLHVNEPSDLVDWHEAAPGRFLVGASFPCFASGRNGQWSCMWDEGRWPGLAWLRGQFESGTFAIMGELTFVYAGISPLDERMREYWALAAELDIPVAVHVNRGPPPDSPARPKGCCPDFDADLGNPELLRPILESYPHLRLILQHAGFPALPELGGIDYMDETFRLLADYPNVYVDMTALNSVPPAVVHEQAIQQFLERGYIDRIMMGTDNWAAQPIIERYRNLAFLTKQQKRGILYDNARRFFRLPSDN